MILSWNAMVTVIARHRPKLSWSEVLAGLSQGQRSTLLTMSGDWRIFVILMSQCLFDISLKFPHIFSCHLLVSWNEWWIAGWYQRKDVEILADKFSNFKSKVIQSTYMMIDVDIARQFHLCFWYVLGLSFSMFPQLACQRALQPLHAKLQKGCLEDNSVLRDLEDLVLYLNHV